MDPMGTVAVKISRVVACSFTLPNAGPVDDSLATRIDLIFLIVWGTQEKKF